MIDYLKKFSLEGKTAVVTGGAGLIGREIVAALAQAGAKTIIVDTDQKGSLALADSLNSEGMSVDCAMLDVTDLDSLENNINELAEKYGSIDIWVNNAYPRTADWGNKVEDITVSSWRKNIDMQLNSYALCSKYAAEAMKAKGGSIINMGSIYGVVGADFNVYKNTEMTMPMAYAAIKGGIVNLSRYLASYYGSDKIRVNTVCPGGVLAGQPAGFINNYSSKVPLGRMAVPEDIASAVLFLAADAGAYVTGATIMVDGGWTAI
ncbi:MAG: SDR family oxidoreductase [Candidatus Margulisiibacteriota bacterium]